MKQKPNIDEFLTSGAGDAADRTATRSVPAPSPVASAKVHREQKIFRLPLDLINTLKREAYERSVATGARVTETDLVEQALHNFFR